MDSVEPDLRDASVNATQDQRLLPFTILDAMILVAGSAVSAWLLAKQREGQRSWPWSHRFGLGITVAHVVVAGIIVLSLWFR
jgi:hypothetical protein